MPGRVVGVFSCRSGLARIEPSLGDAEPNRSCRPGAKMGKNLQEIKNPKDSPSPMHGCKLNACNRLLENLGESLDRWRFVDHTRRTGQF